MSNPEEFSERIPSDTARGREVQELIVSGMEQKGFSPRDVFGVRLALEEALVNAIKHGNRMDPDKSVQVDWTLSDDTIHIVIEDEGEGFDVNDVPDPTDDENLDKPGGRGMMLMRSFMSIVEYNDSGNRLTLEKRKDEEGDD
ncbi:MAG: ATP-binding protein [Planctomycetota bacterium]|jgi:serine/threonine-protein kinase RsbW